MRIGSAYQHDPNLRQLVRQLRSAAWRTKFRPEAQIFGFRHLVKGWTVMDRLGEITVPTLVIAGRDDFVFPPEAQRELAAEIRGARLRIIERAGHNPHEEQPHEVVEAVREFISQPASLQQSGGRLPLRGP
jgi:pimeloyl-ACP methyl ester carboxylesterase